MSFRGGEARVQKLGRYTGPLMLRQNVQPLQPEISIVCFTSHRMADDLFGRIFRDKADMPAPFQLVRKLCGLYREATAWLTRSSPSSFP